MKYQLLLVLYTSITVVSSNRLTFQPIHQSVTPYFEAPLDQPHILGFNYNESLMDDPTALAVNFISQLNPNCEFEVTNSYATPSIGVHHVYMQQKINGRKVANGFANVNVKDGKVVSFGNSFFASVNFAPHTLAVEADISPLDALKSLAESIGISSMLTGKEETVREANTLSNQQENVRIQNVNFALSDVTSNLAYIQVNNGNNLELVWELKVEMDENYLNAFVSATNGKVLEIADWVSDASYMVYPIGINDPSDGSRILRVGDDVDAIASPLGWHNNGGATKGTTTRGNNVYAQDNSSGGPTWETNYRPSGGNNLIFNFNADLTKDPSTYKDAAITNLFYINNMLHDIFYRYGFNEPAGNFQDNNFGKGGRGNDAVIANAQDGSGTNNANFLTPPDGQRGRMRMYVWTVTNPRRDGDFDNGIIIHEFTHGISNRLTGGPSNVNCLVSGQAGGMGEGWGDFNAVILRLRPGMNRTVVFGMGSYAVNRSGGIRNYPYSTNMKTNPETYSYLNKPNYNQVHAMGAVWCQMLLECFWNIVDVRGFDPDWKNGKGGNNIMLKNVIDGMKLQPCSPNFIQARNAILLADKLGNNGDNLCLLWKGFAKRGLGYNATPATEAFDIPVQCNGQPTNIFKPRSVAGPFLMQ